MKRFIKLGLVASLCVVLFSCSLSRTIQKEVYAQTKEVAREIGNTLVGADGTSSAVSIAILHEGSLIFSEGFGKRDREQSLPVDSHTRFNIGSISKIFAAASILLLQEDGLLTLDDTVVDLLPDFSLADERYKDISVRMLLNHTSGMPGTNMRGAFTTKPNDAFLGQSMQEYANSMLKHNPGDFSPYCNDGFTVVEAIVEHLSGLSYSQFLQKRIFHTLDMADTSVGFSFQEENIAYGYIEGTTRLPVEYVNLKASGGITSTAEDLCRYASSLMAQTLVSSESLDAYLAEQKPKFIQESTYSRQLPFGLGWDFVSWEPYHSEGVQVLGKTGGSLQYSTMLFMIPQSHSAVVLLSSGPLNPIETTVQIVDALLKETGQIPSRSKADKAMTKTSQPLPPGIEAYSGYYGGSGLSRLTFNEQDSTLLLETYDGSTYVETGSSRHIGDGIFESEQGAWNTFETLLGVPCFMELMKPYKVANIAMTKLEEKPLIDHAFTESTYMPINVPTNDMYFPIFSISLIDEPTSHLVVGDALFAITSESETSMVLPTLRDQTAPRLTEDGHLEIGSYRCMDVADIPPLRESEKIMIERDEQSVLRRVTEQGTFRCTVPQGGRIIVIGSDLIYHEDTLFSENEQLEMDIFDSYVVFMAEKPMVFEPSFT